MTNYVAFIDDSEERHDAIERTLGDRCCILHAYTYDEAIAILNASHIRIHIACLDHDLGVGKSGSDVASFILNELDTERFPAIGVVHSMNSVGAENVASKLRTAGITTIVFPYSDEMIAKLGNLLEPQ